MLLTSVRSRESLPSAPVHRGATSLAPRGPGVLLAVMLIVFLSACGSSSTPETGNGTQQETSELADDSADNDSADNDSADNDSAFATEEIPFEEFAVP